MVTAKRTGRDYVREAREEKEKMGERATQAASKSAKDDASISNDEAADLVEEARDSALAEGQKKVNNRQFLAYLFIFISIIFLMTTAEPPGY